MTGLSLFVALAVGLALWALVDDDIYRAPRPEPQQQSVDAGAATQVLDRLQTAVGRGDADAARALAVPATADLLVALVDNARALRVDDFGLRYIDEASSSRTGEEWVATVDVTWRFDEFDRAASVAEVLFEFEQVQDETRIAGIGGPRSRTPVWMSGPVSVARTTQTLVLSAGPPAGLPRYERSARVAAGEVAEVLREWRPRLVVEVPAVPAGLASALGAEEGEYAGIAAVTSTPDGSAAPGSPVHVFINPDIYGELGSTGAQVVMTHEAVHVATEAPSSLMPQWLVEGFADYVALREVDLPLSVTAGQIIEQVQKQGVPDALPGLVEFDTQDAHLGAAYESAWIACEVLATRGGEEALVGLYRAVQDGADLEEELMARFGWSQEAFVAAWQARLEELAP